jgi:molecular chaperone GrpE
MDKEQREEEPEDRAQTDASPEVENIENLKAALAEAKARAEANLAGWQRAQADSVNYRKRFEQEKEETVKYASASLLSKLIPVLDDFDRALSNIPKDIADVPWVKGVRATYESMFKTLEVQGLKPIDCKGAVFDPSCHEALMTCKGKEGIVIQEIQKGYMYNHRLLRPARVTVGCGEGEEAKSEREE